MIIIHLFVADSWSLGMIQTLVALVTSCNINSDISQTSSEQVMVLGLVALVVLFSHRLQELFTEVPHPHQSSLRNP